MLWILSSKILNERLKLYLDAEKQITKFGQSYTIGKRTLTRANLSEIRAEINKLIGLGATVDDEMPVKGIKSKQIIFMD